MPSMEDKNPLAAADLKKVYGNPGTEQYGGFFQEEPNADWRDESRVDNVETMRRTDGTVKGLLNGLKSPILSAAWRVETPDVSSFGEQLKGECEGIMYNMKGRTWRDFVREALTFLDFGHSAFEIIWGMRNKKLSIEDLEPRIQHSIFKWEIAGGAPGITQLLKNDKAQSTSAEIPMEKLVIFTNEKEGDDLTGQSVLRPAWKHFYAKDKLYRIGLIASERHGVGTPMIKLPGSSGEEEQTEAKDILRHYRAHEENYVLLPNKEWEMSILSITGNSQSAIIEQQIDHHDKMILRSALMGFIGLDSGDGGSYALSEDQSSFAMKKIEDYVQYFAEQFTRQVFHRYIFVTYPTQYEKLAAENMLPYLSFAPLGDIDYQEYAGVLSTLKSAELLHVTPEMKQFTHSVFKLPEISEEDMEEMRKEKEEEQEEVEAPEMPTPPETPEKPEKTDMPEMPEEEMLSEKCLSNKKFAGFKPYRELTFAEKRVKFAVLETYFNKHEERIQSVLDEFISEQKAKFLTKLETLIENKDVAGITALTLTGLAALKSKLKEETKNAMEVGKSQASGEMKIEVPSTPAYQTQAVNAQIDQMVDEYNEAVVGEAKASAINAILTGIGTAAAIYGIKSAFESTSSSENAGISSTLTGTAVNIGRSLVFDWNRDDIHALQRSEILDDRTCAMCMSIDGRVLDELNPFTKLGQVHNNCRGMWVPILVGDTEIPDIGDLPKSIRSKFETTEGVPSINNFTQLKNPVYTKNSRVAEAVDKGDLDNNPNV